jgi:hypothetical protein
MHDFKFFPENSYCKNSCHIFSLVISTLSFFVSNYAIKFFLNFLLKEGFRLTDAYTRLANGASVGVL